MTLTDLAFSGVNLPLTILIIILSVYRILTMLSGLDLDFDLDFDIDTDMDIDTDTDLGIGDADLEFEDLANAEIKNKAIVSKRPQKLKWWQVFLIYFNFSELPFLFTFTSWIFFWWIITLIGTYYTNSFNNSLGFFIFLAAIIPALIINKIFTTPFKNFFQKLDRKGVDNIDLIGRVGTSLSNISNDKLGSIKLFVENDPINVYAKSLDGSSIKSGDKILIIKESIDKKFYYIKLN